MVFFDKYQKDSGKNIQRFQNDTLKASAYLAVALMKKIFKAVKQDNLGEVELKVEGKTVFQASLNQEKLELKTNKFSHQELFELNQAFSKFSQNKLQPSIVQKQSQPAILLRAGVSQDSNGGEKFPPQIEVLVDGDKEMTLSPEQTQTLMKLMGSLRGNNLEKTNFPQASRDQTSLSLMALAKFWTLSTTPDNRWNIPADFWGFLPPGSKTIWSLTAMGTFSLSVRACGDGDGNFWSLEA